MIRRHYVRHDSKELHTGHARGLASAGTTLPALAIPTAPAKAGFKLCELFGNPQSTDITIAKQIGVNHVITGMGFGRVRKEQYLESAQKTKDAWAAVGMTIAGVEGHPVPFDNLKAGHRRPTRRSRIPSGPSRRSAKSAST